MGGKPTKRDTLVKKDAQENLNGVSSNAHFTLELAATAKGKATARFAVQCDYETPCAVPRHARE